MQSENNSLAATVLIILIISRYNLSLALKRVTVCFQYLQKRVIKKNVLLSHKMLNNKVRKIQTTQKHFAYQTRKS